MTTIGVKLYVTDLEDGELENGIDAFLPLTAEKAEDGKVTFTEPDGDRWVQIKGVQNIPDLQSAPSAIDVTSIEDEEEQSEPGLISGSSLGLTMNYKEGVYKEGIEDDSNFEQCLTLSDDEIRAYKIVLRNGRYFKFFAKARTTMTSMGVAAAQQFTFTLFKRSKVVTGVSKALAMKANGNNTDAQVVGQQDIVSQSYAALSNLENKEKDTVDEQM